MIRDISRRKLAIYVLRKTLEWTGHYADLDRHPLEREFRDATLLVPENMMIGERVSIGPGAFLSADSPISIGNDTMIAARALINTATHDPANHPMRRERISRPIEIGKHAWIGSAAIILPGVRIGDGAVVGAGAVVTAHVPERAIVAGNPARVLRHRDVDVNDSVEATAVGIVFTELLGEEKRVT